MATGNYKHEIDVVQEYGLDVKRREVFLFGVEDYADDEEPGVEFIMANRFIKNLRWLSNINHDPVLIHMKSNGGYWHEGMAIYQAIQHCECHVTIVNYTHARSMTSIILQAADHRVMMPYSTFMYHDGTIGVDGTIKQFFTEAAQAKIECEDMMRIYLDKCEGAPFFEGKTRPQIRRHLRTQMDKKEEVYLNPSQTVAQGFADKVFENWKALK